MGYHEIRPDNEEREIDLLVFFNLHKKEELIEQTVGSTPEEAKNSPPHFIFRDDIIPIDV